MLMAARYDIAFEWVHLSHKEPSAFVETYGFAGNQGAINLEGIRITPVGKPSDTLLVFMHPASTLQLLPVPRAAAQLGAHVLCAGSRYQRNDTAAILEKVVLDLGAYIRHAREAWGYTNVVLVGWSGGGSLALFYQAQAERPTITQTPAGDPIDLATCGLIPGDAVIFQAAHISRARLLLDTIDPSVRAENDPDDLDPHLNLYDPRNPNQPPYDAGFIGTYRAAQLARMRRITAWAKQRLEYLRKKGGSEVERGFVTHRTLADPRFLDPALDPNDRRPGWCYLGHPEAVNSGPVGLARFSTLRSWLSQWSLDDSQADGLRAAATLRAPLLVIENGADDAVPQTHPKLIFDAAGSTDKRFAVIKGATHYYAGQPQLLEESTTLIRTWLLDRWLLSE
jgi:pimeloyl-ACP methyl ester carboxylesterase